MVAIVPEIYGFFWFFFVFSMFLLWSFVRSMIFVVCLGFFNVFALVAVWEVWKGLGISGELWDALGDSGMLWEP